MLCLSKTTGYAILAMSSLETGECRGQHIEVVSRCSGVPRPYLCKIINSLSQHGLVRTKRGYRGGIVLARDPAEISLLEIVEAVEGQGWLGECLLGMEDCHIKVNCVTHPFWSRIRREITEELRDTTLASLIRFKHRRTTRTRKRPSKQKARPVCCPV